MQNTSNRSAPDPANFRGSEAGGICRPAEALFQKGLSILRAGEAAPARMLFEAAIDLQRRSGSLPQPRYLSFYGLTLIDQPSRRSSALELCRRAVREEFFNPDLFLNLARVCLRTGNKAEAHRAAMCGLAIDPKHPTLGRQVADMGLRRNPPLRFLSRSNFLNVALGRWLHSEPIAAPGRVRAAGL